MTSCYFILQDSIREVRGQAEEINVSEHRSYWVSSYTIQMKNISAASYLSLGLRSKGIFFCEGRLLIAKGIILTGIQYRKPPYGSGEIYECVFHVDTIEDKGKFDPKVLLCL